MKPRTKNLLALALLGVFVIAVGVGIYLLATGTSDPSWRVRQLGGEGILSPRDYRSSRLFVNSNGTFEIEIIQTIGENDEIIFTGVGTYTKTRTTYTFTFTDSYTDSFIGPPLDNAAPYPVTRPPYQISGRGRIQFISHWGGIFYFGR